MTKRYIRHGKCSISIDDTGDTLTLQAGSVAIELNGESERIAILGPVSEMNQGDRTEEVFLRKEAGIMTLIPSTVATPVAQASPNIPIESLAGMVQDLATMMTLLA